MDIYPIQCLTVQATPFCNLDCKYCYLPYRSKTDRFDIDLIPHIFKNMEDSRLMQDEFIWDWHAGEPLVPGIEFYKQTTAAIRKHQPKGVQVHIGMQTNATLITEEFAKFFKKNKFRIGVSIDGPEHIQNHNRVYRNQKGSFQDAMKGIAWLEKYEVPYHIISVLSDYSLDFPDEMHDFFSSLGTQGVAFNIEEVEGIHTTSSVQSNSSADKFEEFFYRFFELHFQKEEPFQIREWDKFNRKPDNDLVNGTTVPFAHLTIDIHGNFSTFSPELITIENNPAYPSFIFGNIKHDRIIDSINHPELLRIYQDIQKGVSACKSTCEYYAVCGGGMVSNKLFENGSFESTTTMACTYMIKRMFEITYHTKKDLSALQEG